MMRGLIFCAAAVALCSSPAGAQVLELRCSTSSAAMIDRTYDQVSLEADDGSSWAPHSMRVDLARSVAFDGGTELAAAVSETTIALLISSTDYPRDRVVVELFRAAPEEALEAEPREDDASAPEFEPLAPPELPAIYTAVTIDRRTGAMQTATITSMAGVALAVITNGHCRTADGATSF